MPDAEILRAVAAWRAANQAVLDTPDEGYDQEVFDGLCDAEGEALEAVRATPAATIEGMRAKASVLNVVIRRHRCPGAPLSEEDEMALSLCADLAAELPEPDAELIRICHQFAERELTNWYRYVTAPGDVADEQDPPPDWGSLHWIVATPATTPEGWQAKALAYSVWCHEAYDNSPDDRDNASPLLAGLLRDMVAPTRNAIVARLAEQYGPLPERYTAEGIWLGRVSA